jgi:2,3-bisphosphoglycerate-independent phosphoglycerate mutase
MPKLNALIILDGFAISDKREGNAIYKSGIPHIKALLDTYPNTLLGASGMDVGLPDGQMGNSEVGHLNIGAGRIVYQELTRISKSITDGDFYNNPALLKAVKNAKDKDKSLHLMGLLSDGGVHSHIEHLFALIRLCKQYGLTKVYVHCFMDGRDVSPVSGAGFIKELSDYMKATGTGKIATVMGRYYAMDRDNRWERIEKAYCALTLGAGNVAEDPVEAVRKSYREDVTDEFIYPIVVYENNKPVTKISEGDSIIFFNFRPDRARELTRAFIEENFDKFNRVTGFLRPQYVSMTQYDEKFTGLDIAYPLKPLTDTFGEYISKLGLKQLRIAETEKYAHVTFFFNGNVEFPNDGEDRVLIPSPKVPTYDLKPEMSAYEVTNKAIELIRSDKYDVMILNFANCDMVGHTGVFDAAVSAVSAVDECVNMLVNTILETGGAAMLTADHGNADTMLDENGDPFTAHSLNPVPFILINNDLKAVGLRSGGRLSDITPTMLDVMGIEKPKDMTGETLIIR